jgi:hypothetical protein
MHRIPLHAGRVKPVALATMYACYVIGYDWRVANGLPVDQ